MPEQARLYAAYHYDRHMRLRVPLQLWLGFALGLVHVLSHWPVVGFLLGPLGPRLADWRLMAGDALNVLVLVAAGHRTPQAGVRMRWLWAHGRQLLLLAHALAVAGFALHHGPAVAWGEAAEVLPVLALLAAHAALMLYLWRSPLARDLFLDFPEPGDEQAARLPALPVQQRERQARRLHAQCLEALEALPAGADAGARQAVAVLEQALHDAEAWHALGMACLALGWDTLALQCVRLSAQLDGRQARYQQNLGELERRAGDLEAALRHGLAATRLAPQDAHAHYNLAVAQAQAGQAGAALASYRQAVALQPGHAPAWNNLGVLWQAHGDLAQALQAYENALRADPSHAQARLNWQRLQAPVPPVAQPGSQAAQP